MGPPEPLKSLEVGQSVNAFRSVEHQEDEQRIDFSIERVSNTPNIYVLRNFVTPFECEQIQTLAKERGMKMAETITKNDTKSRKNCSVAWLPSSSGPDSSSIVSGLVASTANIFLSNSVKSHPTAGVEDLQVLKYDIGGEFVHHHDGDCRILTVIYYINGVGGTWFPLADEDCASGTNNNLPKNKAKALELAEDLVPGEHGILLTGSGGGGDSGTRTVRVNKGDAVAFYNYLDEGSAQLDWTALHCGLPTSEKDETKWIANHWYRLNVLASY